MMIYDLDIVHTVTKAYIYAQYFTKIDGKLT